MSLSPFSLEDPHSRGVLPHSWGEGMLYRELKRNPNRQASPGPLCLSPLHHTLLSNHITSLDRDGPFLIKPRHKNRQISLGMPRFLCHIKLQLNKLTLPLSCYPVLGYRRASLWPSWWMRKYHCFASSQQKSPPEFTDIFLAHIVIQCSS